jgi:hypothetical protein
MVGVGVECESLDCPATQGHFPQYSRRWHATAGCVLVASILEEADCFCDRAFRISILLSNA